MTKIRINCESILTGADYDRGVADQPTLQQLMEWAGAIPPDARLDLREHSIRATWVEER